MQNNERCELAKSILELHEKLNNYDRESAIELIKKVRRKYPGMEELAYVTNNVRLEDGTDEMIMNTLRAEKVRLGLKLNVENNKK